MSLTTSVVQNNSKEKPWHSCQYHDANKTSIKKPDEFSISQQDYPPLSSIDKDNMDRIQGSLFGLAIGDALGAHVEFRPHSYLAAHPVTDLVGGGTWGLKEGQFTDDTSMALCLAISLINRQNFVPYDQLVRYKWWYRHGYMSSTGHCFDIGAATKESIEAFENRQKQFAKQHKIPLDKIDSLSDPDLLQQFNVQCSQDGVAGNGALMRLVPVPLFFFRHPAKAVEYSGISGKITHGDVKADDACRYYGALIVAALRGEKKSELTSDTFYENHLDWFGDQKLHPDVMKIAKGSYKKAGGYEDGIRGKGYIIDSLEAALWAFWSDNNLFETGVLNAVNLGDDTDTTAAIYGQLAGAHYGYNNLPKKWLHRIYAKNFMYCVGSWIAYEGKKWFINQTIETSSSAIIRKSIDSSGCIGYLYDAWRDRIIKSDDVNMNMKQISALSSLHCVIKSGDQLENQNFFQLINCCADFRLSVLSNLVQPASSIASVINYPYELDEHTRIFYYSYYFRNEAILDELRNAAEICTVPATHIITGIEQGIDVVVLLRLPALDSKAIDDDLNKICEHLNHDTVFNDNADALDRITSTHIYSNLPNLAKQTRILDVYREICRIKNTHHEHQPCSYILHPIGTFLLHEHKNNTKFIPIELSAALSIEDHWFRFLSLKKIWDIFQADASHNVWQINYKEQYETMKKKVLLLLKQYEEEKKQAQNLIVRIRQGKEPQESIQNQLKLDEEDTELKNIINELKTAMKTWTETVKHSKSNNGMVLRKRKRDASAVRIPKKKKFSKKRKQINIRKKTSILTLKD